MKDHTFEFCDSLMLALPVTSVHAELMLPGSRGCTHAPIAHRVHTCRMLRWRHTQDTAIAMQSRGQIFGSPIWFKFGDTMVGLQDSMDGYVS